jgi:DNA-binding transcriptional ArsR family regulator
MDTIFKALNDPARRALLDSLRKRDGQTLTELEEQLDMTRFGVMKHLKVLEDAHLIVTRRQGRFKHHYLNALPLQEMLDRWVAPFLQPAGPCAQRSQVTIGKRDRHGKTRLHDADLHPLFAGCALGCADPRRPDGRLPLHVQRGAWRRDRPGNVTRFVRPDGDDMLRQVTTEMDPKSRIAMTFEPVWWARARPPRTWST